jgi:broad specificity phosphatase PhoE
VILLARHGETDDNRSPLRFQGQRDTPLNEAGRAQAHELAERVATGGPIASLWSSDLSRARETAEIVGARVSLEPRLDARLREGHRGDWEGRLFADVERAEPERYAAWCRAGADFRFPGGESLAEQQARVLAVLADVEEELFRASATASGSPSRDVASALVICHGGSIRVVLCAADPRGLDAFHGFEVPNAALLEAPRAEAPQL